MRAALCRIARPNCEPKAHPDYRWTVRKSARRSLQRAPRFACGHALTCVIAITRIRVSSARASRAFKALHVAEDMKNPSEARRSGGVQNSDRTAFRQKAPPRAARASTHGVVMPLPLTLSRYVDLPFIPLLSFACLKRDLSHKGRGFYASRLAVSIPVLAFFRARRGAKVLPSHH
jgi:hypothetical protein